MLLAWYISIQILTFKKLNYIIIYNCLSYSTSLLKVLGSFLSSLEMDSQIHPFMCLCHFPPDLSDRYKVCIFLLLSASLAPAPLVLPLLWVLCLVLFGCILGLSPLLPVLVVELVWLRPLVPFYPVHQSVLSDL